MASALQAHWASEPGMEELQRLGGYMPEDFPTFIVDYLFEDGAYRSWNRSYSSIAEPTIIPMIMSWKLRIS